MALDDSRLLNNLQSAFVAAGAQSGAPLTTLVTGIRDAIMIELRAATVSPAGAPTPLTAPPSGGPVTGTGKLT